MSEPAHDPRLDAARRLLAAEGVEGARVRAAGHEREIAAVAVPREHAARVQALVPELKRLGFRYVALDLGRGA